MASMFNPASTESAVPSGPSLASRPSAAAGPSGVSASSVVHTSVGVRLDRAELLLLLSSALSSLGCVETVRALRRETGVTSEQRAVERVRAAILAGDWQQANSKCDKLLLAVHNTAGGGAAAGGGRQHGRRQRALMGRVSAILHAGCFLDQLHAAIESQQPPVEALDTLTRHIATIRQGSGRVEAAAAAVDAGSDIDGDADLLSTQLAASDEAPLAFIDLCDRWLPSASPSSSTAALRGRPPRLSSLLCVLSSLLLCCSAGELSRRSGCDVSTLAWRPLLADRVIECLPRASAVPHNQLANMLALAAITAAQQQQQHHQHPLQHSQLQQLLSHPQPAVTEKSAVDISLLAPTPQSIVVTGGCVAHLVGHTDEVLYVCWSTSHRMLASASKDQSVRLWAAERVSSTSDQPVAEAASSTSRTPSQSSASFTVHRVLVGHNSCLWHCSWSRDDTMLLACGDSTEVSIWNTATGQRQLLCDSGHREPLHSAYFVDGDRAFVTGSPDKQIIMRDISGAMLHRWGVELSTDIHVTHNQRFIVSATQQALLEAIDVKSKRRTHMALSLAHSTSQTGTSHPSASVSGPPASPLSSSLVSPFSCFLSCFSLSDDDGRALITATQPAELLSVDVEPLCAALASSASSSPSNSVSYLNASVVASGSVFPPLPAPLSAHSAAAAGVTAGSGSLLAASAAAFTSRGSLRVVHRSGGFIQSRLVLRGCYVSSSLDVCAVGSEDCSVSVLHLPSGRRLRRLVGHSGAVNCVAWSRQRQCLVSASDDHTLRVWRLRHDQPIPRRAAVGDSNGQQLAGAEEDSEDDEDDGTDAEGGGAVQQQYDISGRTEEGADRKRRRRRNAAHYRPQQRQQSEKAATEARATVVHTSI